MKQNEHKRVKHGEQPGDILRKRKIQMREHPNEALEIPYGSFIQVISQRAVKVFNRVVKERGRKVQRRRDRFMVEEGLNES